MFKGKGVKGVRFRRAGGSSVSALVPSLGRLVTASTFSAIVVLPGGTTSCRLKTVSRGGAGIAVSRGRGHRAVTHHEYSAGGARVTGGHVDERAERRLFLRRPHPCLTVGRGDAKNLLGNGRSWQLGEKSGNPEPHGSPCESA